MYYFRECCKQVKALLVKQPDVSTDLKMPLRRLIVALLYYYKLNENICITTGKVRSVFISAPDSHFLCVSGTHRKSQIT